MKKTAIPSYGKCQLNFSVLKEIRLLIIKGLEQANQQRMLDVFNKEHTKQWNTVDCVIYAKWLTDKLQHVSRNQEKGFTEDMIKDRNRLIKEVELFLSKGRNR